MADSLKVGSNVMPELYKEASVYFSDIVSFTTLASESTPMEVVDFLNDLWTVFDDIINKFNVYKVRAFVLCRLLLSSRPTYKNFTYTIFFNKITINAVQGPVDL